MFACFLEKKAGYDMYSVKAISLSGQLLVQPFISFVPSAAAPFGSINKFLLQYFHMKIESF